MSHGIRHALRGVQFGLGRDRVGGIEPTHARPIGVHQIRQRATASSPLRRLFRFFAHIQFEGLGREPDVYPAHLPAGLSRAAFVIRDLLRDPGDARASTPVEAIDEDTRIFTLRPLALVAGVLAIPAVFSSVSLGSGWGLTLILVLSCGVAVAYEVTAVRRRVADRRPDLPVFLSVAGVSITERSRLTYALEADGSVVRRAGQTDGEVVLSGTMTLKRERARYRTYRARFGRRPHAATAGFLAFGGQPALTWRDQRQVSRYGAAVIRLANLLDDPDMTRRLEVEDAHESWLLKRAWPFDVPASTKQVGAQLSFLTSLDREQGSRIIRMTLRNGLPVDPDDVDPAERYRFAGIEGRFLDEFPPVERVTAEYTDARGTVTNVALRNVVLPTEGSGFSVTAQGDGPVLDPGARLAIFVWFREDLVVKAFGAVRLRGTARLYHGTEEGAVSAVPRCGASSYQYFDAFGRPQFGEPRPFNQVHLETDVEFDLSLAHLRGIRDESQKTPVLLPADFTVDDEFVFGLVRRIAERALHVRQVREDREGDKLYWDILVRDNTSMFSPDIRLVVTGLRGQALGRPRTTIEISVLGRVRNQKDADDLATGVETMRSLVEEAVGQHHASSTTGSAGEPGDLAALVRRLETSVARLEELVQRLNVVS